MRKLIDFLCIQEQINYHVLTLVNQRKLLDPTVKPFVTQNCAAKENDNSKDSEYSKEEYYPPAPRENKQNAIVWNNIAMQVHD